MRNAFLLHDTAERFVRVSMRAPREARSAIRIARSAAQCLRKRIELSHAAPRDAAFAADDKTSGLRLALREHGKGRVGRRGSRARYTWGVAHDSAERFQAVQAHFAELAQYFPDGFAAIGGFAVWLHSARLQDAEREGTDDGDAMLTRQDFEELKSLHVVEDNERLGKHQFRADGIEFDLYVEYERTDIRVPVTEVLARSVVIDGIRTACLEDLLVMKLDAALGREGSGHGRKDERDIAKIVMLLDEPDERVLVRYLGETHLAKLERVGANQDLFRDIARGNPYVGSKLHDRFADRWAAAAGRMRALGRNEDRGRSEDL